MTAITYSLKTPKSKKSAIWASLTDGRDFRVKLYPGISIESKHWSKKNKNILSANTDSVALNEDLREFKKDILSIYLQARNEGKVKKVLKPSGNEYEYFPKANYFKDQLDKLRLSRNDDFEEKESQTFWALWETFLKSKKGIFKKHSFTKFNSLAGHLTAFEKQTNVNFDLDSITEITIEDFQLFCYHTQNLNTQSTSKYIGILKIFLNWCVQRKFTHNIDFRNFTPIMQPDTLKVIITDEELNQIRKVDLNEKNYLKNARELFLLSCLTGLRFSDYSRIQAQHLKKDSDGIYILQIRQQKTNDFVELPLTPEAEGIVKKLISGEVHPISNQKMNQFVKELCKLADIVEPFEVHRFVGKDKQTELVPKHELISTHTGRRTFATTLLNRGVPAETVMNFTGHKDYKSFSKYVNIPKKTEMDTVKRALLSGGETIMKVTA